MNYQGMMDGWHGDENECHGHCGVCESCDEQFYQSCDEAYDDWREEGVV
jgi:hypothetical protein